MNNQRSQIFEQNVSFLYGWCWGHIYGMIGADYNRRYQEYQLYENAEDSYFDWLHDNGYEDSEEMQKDFCRNAFELCGFSDEIVNFAMSAWDKELDPVEVKNKLASLEE